MPATTRPTADDIERLSQQVRQDPGSEVFVDLGEALLALSRPKDAIEVGARGLKANPNSIPGRMMVSRAFAMLHKWKEAQAELLKVVKADKRHQAGFRLLGEVLMRRQDYDRALPVLQHAQNLDPADAGVLGMLKRARQGTPLDPPPPVPTPMAPAGARNPARRSAPPPPPRPRADPFGDDAPTRVADSMGGAGAMDDVTEQNVSPAPERAALGRMDLEQREVRGSGRSAPRESGVRRSDGRGRDDEAAFRVMHHEPPPPEDPFAPLDDASVRSRLPLAPGEKTGQTSPAPSASTPPKVRPRVMQAGERQDRGAAGEALRESAAVGENYLNNLLTNGLLDVPNVSVPAPRPSVDPDKVWGRSSKKTFIVLFAVLFAAVGAGGGYYYWTEQQKSKAVAKHLAAAREALPGSTYQGLRAGLDEALSALARDEGNPEATAVWAHLASMELLIYGEPGPDKIERALQAAARGLGKGDAGWHELEVARIAYALALVDPDDEDAVRKLADARKMIDAAKKAYPEDRTVDWLDGVAHDLAGDREAARAAFERGDDDGKGPVIARIAVADMALDDGKFGDARMLYDRALDRAPKHPYAIIGRSLSRSEQSVEAAEAVADINVEAADAAGARVQGWKELAMASAQLLIEDYEEFDKKVEASVGVRAPRFLARVGLAHLAAGRVKEALVVRQKIKWASESPKPHPLVAALDAELFLANGLPTVAVSTLEGVEGMRAHRARGRALFDLSKHEEAIAELDAVLEVAKEDRDALMWREAARYASSRSLRDEAGDALDTLGRQAKAKDVRTVHGLALWHAGQTKAARSKLELSLEEITPEYPNPLAYRAHTVLADLDLADGQVTSAAEHAKAAVEQNPSYLPARAVMGRVLLAQGDPSGALEQLVDVVTADVASAADELAFAESLLSVPNVADEDRQTARDALARAAKKGASSEEVERVEALVDPEAAAPEPSPRKKRRRRRR